MLWLAVAVAAAKTLMRPGESEIGHGPVVELPEVPTIGVVARRAVLVEFPLVHIFGTVTAEASIRRIAIRPARMTFLAGHTDVQANQRELREVVVELHVVAPASLLVAGLAVATHRVLVYVVNAMAAGTIFCHFLLLEHAAMATVTIELCMRPAKREFGTLFVIEYRDRPLVLFMAVSAGGTEPARMEVGRRVTAAAFPG